MWHGCPPSCLGTPMAQVFSVCRIGSAWVFRDVTGAHYAQSEDIIYVVEAAERMANRLGGRVDR